jgi:hypothetical protein
MAQVLSTQYSFSGRLPLDWKTAVGGASDYSSFNDLCTSPDRFIIPHGIRVIDIETGRQAKIRASDPSTVGWDYSDNRRVFTGDDINDLPIYDTTDLDASPPIYPDDIGITADGKIYIYVEVSGIVQPDTTPFLNISSFYTGEHNNLNGIQGGIDSQYFHLTEAEHIIATQEASFSVSGYLTNEAQNIGGVKAFNAFPTGPADDPTDDREFAHKKYVDSLIIDYSGGENIYINESGVVDLEIDEDVIPETTDVINIGSEAYKFNIIYANAGVFYETSLSKIFKPAFPLSGSSYTIDLSKSNTQSFTVSIGSITILAENVIERYEGASFIFFFKPTGGDTTIVFNTAYFEDLGSSVMRDGELYSWTGVLVDEVGSSLKLVGSFGLATQNLT